MVKFSPALLVITTLALSVFASPIEHRDIIKVEDDLQRVGHDITDIDNLVAGLSGKLSLHDALVNTISLHRLGLGCSDKGIGHQSIS